VRHLFGLVNELGQLALLAVYTVNSIMNLVYLPLRQEAAMKLSASELHIGSRSISVRLWGLAGVFFCLVLPAAVAVTLGLIPRRIAVLLNTSLVIPVQMVAMAVAISSPENTRSRSSASLMAGPRSRPGQGRPSNVRNGR
jgi:hypothetical protein